MMGFGYGMGGGGWIAMTIFWVGLITLIIWGVSRALPTGNGWGGNPPPRQYGAPDGCSESAEDIVDRRFAAGELDEDAYRAMCVTLRSSRATQSQPR